MSNASPQQRIANIHTTTTYHPGSAAADATEDWAVFTAPAAGYIRKAAWVPNAAVTGAATNHFSIAFVNKLTAGVGTGTIGTAITYAAGTNAVAYDEQRVFNPDTTSRTAVAKGDVIAFRRTLVGTGLAAPEGGIVIDFEAEDWPS